MNPTSSVSQTSIKLRGKAVPGALGRQEKLVGFDQRVFSASHILCIGAGGLISKIAPPLVRKGIGGLILVDHDLVEPSNLNRQWFYEPDLGKNKALALASNLWRESTFETRLTAYAKSFQEAASDDVDLACDVVVCGVDNNPTRVAVSRYFRERGISVVFTAVSADADHGYVFVQDRSGGCIGCVFPDMADDQTYPCPGVPAVSDILQFVGSLALYAIDTCLMERRRDWNYRAVRLSSGAWDSSRMVSIREPCNVCSSH